MPFPYFDRTRLKTYPLKGRENRVLVERDFVASSAKPAVLPPEKLAIIRETAVRICQARSRNGPVIMAFGAHMIKNGLGPVLIDLIEKGWITHLATNGAGVIHDWEFAFQGASSEHVHANLMEGKFGHWQETGFYINLALASGAYAGMGYGEAIGAMIENEGLLLPEPEALRQTIIEQHAKNPETAAAAADLLGIMQKNGIPGGRHKLEHPYKRCSVQAAAYRSKIPFTAHPMFGHDIIYTHPLNCGAAIGRTAERDFLSFANSVSGIDKGVYLSIGSAVMSPMIFEKAFAMAQNLSLQKGRRIENHYLLVADLADVKWDWRKDGEPPETHAAYYLRFCKTFSRAGGAMRYLQVHNRDFLLALADALRQS